MPEKQKPKCACGCGEVVTHWGNKYLQGHSTRGKHHNKKTRKLMKESQLKASLLQHKFEEMRNADVIKKFEEGKTF